VKSSVWFKSLDFFWQKTIRIKSASPVFNNGICDFSTSLFLQFNWLCVCVCVCWAERAVSSQCGCRFSKSTMKNWPICLVLSQLRIHASKYMKTIYERYQCFTVQRCTLCSSPYFHLIIRTSSLVCCLLYFSWNMAQMPSLYFDYVVT